MPLIFSTMIGSISGRSQTLMTNRIWIAADESFCHRSVDSFPGAMQSRLNTHLSTGTSSPNRPPMSLLSAPVFFSTSFSGFAVGPGMLDVCVDGGMDDEFWRRESFDLRFQILDLRPHVRHLNEIADSTNIRTAGVISTRSSAGISDIRVMRMMSQIIAILQRPISARDRLR